VGRKSYFPVPVSPSLPQISNWPGGKAEPSQVNCYHVCIPQHFYRTFLCEILPFSTQCYKEQKLTFWRRMYALHVDGCMGSMGSVACWLYGGHLLLALYGLWAVGNIAQCAESYMAV